MHSLFTQYPEIPNSANNYFKDGYTPTFYSFGSDFTDAEKGNCRLDNEDVSNECLHDYKVTGKNMDVLTETKDLVQTLIKDIAKLSKCSRFSLDGPFLQRKLAVKEGWPYKRELACQTHITIQIENLGSLVSLHEVLKEIWQIFTKRLVLCFHSIYNKCMGSLKVHLHLGL